MGTPKGTHERPASPSGDPVDDMSETATLRTEDVVGSSGRAADSGNRANRADQAHDDLGSQGSASASEPDALEAAIKARVVQTLFGTPIRPSTLGRYIVLGTLGQGGMGTVLEAFDRTLARKVAIKVLHEHLDDKYTARLLREARALAKLSHPNVVPVFEANTTDGQTFVVMELVQGRTLRHWIRQHPRPDWRQCVEVFIQAGRGLAAAHAQGLIHRDFKPSNTILDDEGRARVLDFGLARRTEVDMTDEDGPGREGDQTDHDRDHHHPAQQSTGTGTMQALDNDRTAFVQALTETGAVMGTPAYMPPEQMKGHEADARSDQFSFCVSLYEAVYGKRPFEGSTLTELTASMTRGRIRPVPKGSSVPTRLRTILLRGLALEPDKRWPSMEALLHQLHTLVAPRPRRWVALGLTTGLAALGGGLALGQYAQVKERCTGAPAQMDGIWDDARRGQVQAALLGTERSLAPDTWARIEPRLDAYAQGWVETHTEACEATSVRGEQSEDALDLRMRCLDLRRTTLRATVDVLADADTEVVDNAIELVAGLPTLTRCDDLEWLEHHDHHVPPPEDPDVAAAVKAQRTRLAEIEAMDKAGHSAEALGELRATVEQAQMLDYPPLWAEALDWRGTLRHRTGQYEEAEQDLRRAYTLAIEQRHDPIALHAAQILTRVVGVALARPAEGRQWGEMVALPLAQRSGEPLQEANSLNDLGLVLDKQGDYEGARLHFERALAIQQEVLGSDHPQVARSLSTLGHVLQRQGDYDDARIHHQRALTIGEKVLGPDHPQMAHALLGLATVALDAGDRASARSHAEQAVSIREAATVAPNLLAEARFALARALWSTHHEQARALALANQARDALAAAKAPGDTGVDLAQIDAWLAEHRSK
ncbi:MAG: serine/threonine-protein kinase [Myxococcota bacterium]